MPTHVGESHVLNTGLEVGEAAKQVPTSIGARGERSTRSVILRSVPCVGAVEVCVVNLN